MEAATELLYRLGLPLFGNNSDQCTEGFVTGAINMSRRPKCITCIRNKVGRWVGADWICHRSRNNLSERASSSGKLTERYTATGEVCYGGLYMPYVIIKFQNT